MLKDLLRQLCALDGPSGDEGKVAEYIRNYASKYTDDILTDAIGNVIVTVKGEKTAKSKIAAAAHMDEVGLIATSVTDKGYIKFSNLGSIDKRVLPGKRVFFGDTAGVIGMKPVHLVPAAEREKAIDPQDMYIDIGASSKEEAAKIVSVGDTAVFDREFIELNDGFIKSKAIDDRVGCAVLLTLMENPPVDMTFVFTAQEEVGTRGAQIAANRVQPDITLILEGTTAADLPGVPDSKKVCKVGGGAVSPFMDGGSIADRELWQLCKNVAERENIAWQTKEYISGGTDGAAFQKAGTGSRVLGIAAPVRNLHSAACVAKYSDIEAVYELAKAFLTELAGTAE